MQYSRKKLRNLDHYAKSISINLLMTYVYQNQYTDKRTLKNSNDYKVILHFQSVKKIPFLNMSFLGNICLKKAFM